MLAKDVVNFELIPRSPLLHISWVSARMRDAPTSRQLILDLKIAQRLRCCAIHTTCSNKCVWHMMVVQPGSFLSSGCLTGQQNISPAVQRDKLSIRTENMYTSMVSTKEPQPSHAPIILRLLLIIKPPRRLDGSRRSNHRELIGQLGSPHHVTCRTSGFAVADI